MPQLQKQSATGPVWLQNTGVGRPLKVTGLASHRARAAAIGGAPLTLSMNETELEFQLL